MGNENSAQPRPNSSSLVTMSLYMCLCGQKEGLILGSKMYLRVLGETYMNVTPKIWLKEISVKPDLLPGWLDRYLSLIGLGSASSSSFLVCSLYTSKQPCSESRK